MISWLTSSGAVVAEIFTVGNGVHRLAVGVEQVIGHRHAETFHQGQVGVEGVSGIARYVRPVPETHDGVARRCADVAVLRAHVVEAQHRALDRSQELKAGYAAVGHSEQGTDLGDIQPDHAPQRLDQFQPAHVEP